MPWENNCHTHIYRPRLGIKIHVMSVTKCNVRDNFLMNILNGKFHYISLNSIFAAIFYLLSGMSLAIQEQQEALLSKIRSGLSTH